MTMRKVLVVDDSKSARYALKMLLQKHNCEVDMVESAEMALQRVNESPPDAIFMDHLMPTMDGFQGLDALKANPKTAHIPVVMCTANDEPKYQKEAREKGALGILPKPGTLESLTAMLASIDAAMIAPQPGGSGSNAAASGAGNIKAEVQSMLDKMKAEIEQTLATQITKLRSEIAQAVVQKIAQDVLPNMLRQGAEQLEQRILQRLSHGK